MKELGKKALFLIQQAGSLMIMVRSHYRSLGTTFDTIASHSYHVSVIAYVIAKMEGLSDQEAQKCCTMAVFHDLAEARTGDHDFIAKNYNSCNEEKAIEHQFEGVPGEEGLNTLLEEYETRESFISLCVKDADIIAQLHHERVLMWQGNTLAKQRYEIGKTKRVPFTRTDSAKTLAKLMDQSNPNERWWEQFIEEDFSQEHLTGKGTV